jgi:hypothetical protein
LIQFWKTWTAKSSLYNPKENISLDKSLTLCKGQKDQAVQSPTEFKTSLLNSVLHVSETCENLLYTVESTDQTSSVVPADSIKTRKFVVKLVESRFGRGSTLCGQFVQSALHCLLLKKLCKCS